MIRAEPDQSAKSPTPVLGTMCPNHEPGSDSRPPCWTVTEPSRPSSVRPLIRSVATYDRHPSSAPADMNSVVDSPMIPAVKVLAKVITPSQSASRPATCRDSKLSTLKRAINDTVPPAVARGLLLQLLGGDAADDSRESARGPRPTRLRSRLADGALILRFPAPAVRLQYGPTG